ncbi:MAG TPA: GNAT family N-acyltransferase [Candidatus Sulfotelmatobacter sp.]|nr:GNAT family N-acyltransferase [Candidatus Sulfotelmatobacter sp.]
MPSNQLQTDQSQAEVFSRVARFPGLAGKLAPLGRVRNLYRRAQHSPHGFRLESLLAEMRIDLRIDPSDRERIPSAGPTIVVANHPYGVLDGALLTVLLTKVRPDVRVLTNFLLADVPELHEHCIFVDPFETDRSIESNRKAMRDALSWLQHGGMLAIFPSGEVSQWQMPAAQVEDPAWNDTAVRLIRRTGATALPIYFCGHNSVGFQLLGMIHPKLRTAFLLQEFLKQEGKSVEVRVGSPIAADTVIQIPDDRQAIEYLRWRTYLLSRRRKPETSWPATLRTKFISKIQEAVAPAVPADELASDIARLASDRCLAETSDFSVYLAKAHEIPQLLKEIGRLREFTFRRAGEGTGKSLDLDSFDEYYWHILLWQKNKREVVGAYRAGNTAEIIAQRGVSGLYTSTLFRYDECLFEKLGPALELGRSFVRPEYQRQYAPLLLLWKGIARVIATHPDIPVLFGPVSISNDYNRASREMIYRFFESRMHDDNLAGLIEPRRKFRPAFLRQWDCQAMCRALRDIDELSEPITDVESDGKGLPILLRQYAKVGGKLLGFNVDRKFSNVLDGLVVVDLRQTDPAVLERYMGKDAAAKFREVHGLKHSALVKLV